MDLNLLSEKQAQTLDNMLRAANHIVIVGHSRPDGDALGSCLSWANYLTVHYGKQPVVIVPNAYPDFLHWLPGSEQIVRYDKHPDKVKQYLDEADLLCCLDFNQLSRVDDMADLLTACKAQRLLFDHHLGKDKIYRNVFNNYSSWAIRLRGYLMSQKLNVLDDLHASYYTVTRQDMRDYHFVRGDIEGLVNEPLRIRGMKCSISLREDDRIPNRIWVSLRSVDDFSVEDMAKRFFNGGGHFNASGGQLNGTMEEAEKTTREAIAFYADQLRKD